MIEVGGFPSATDYILCQNAITSNPRVACSAQGSDGNVDFVLTGKGGLGRVYVNSIAAYFDNAGNLTVNNCTGCGGGGGATPPFTDTTYLVKGNADATKQFRIDTSTNVSTTTNVVGAVPGNTNFTFAGTNLNQTFSGNNTFSNQVTLNNGLNASGTAANFNNGMNVSGTAAMTAGSFAATLTLNGALVANGSTQFGAAYSANVFTNGWNVGNLSTGIVGNYNSGVPTLQITNASGEQLSTLSTGIVQTNTGGVVGFACGGNSGGGDCIVYDTNNSYYIFLEPRVLNGGPKITLQGPNHNITLNANTGQITLDGVAYNHP